MSFEEIGMGAGGGILGTIVAYFGFSKRLDSIEKKAEIDRKELTARVVAVEEQTVYKDVHTECSRSWHEHLASMDKKLDILLAERRPKGG